jgi:putative Ca2+/H+ antiporter (TMEM165/GDT1 family)
MDALPILSAFLLILVAELGDKTQLSVISLSSSYKWQHVFAGSMLAFLAVDGLSIAVGGPLLALVPLRYVQIVSGIVFVIFGVVPLLRKEKTNDVPLSKPRSTVPLLASFSLIALMELGDKTQIISIALAAQSSLILVLVGMVSAFALLTGAAVLIGARLVSRLPMKWLKIGTSTLFIALGAISIVSGIFQISLF